MNPKLKLLVIVAIPIVGVALWIFSLFSLLSPADISPDQLSGVVQNDSTGSTATVNLPTGNPLTGIKPADPPRPLIDKSLKVAMPIRMYNEPWRRPIINKLAQQQIKVQIITNTRTQSYDEFVESLIVSGATGADIILLNNDQLSKYGENAGSFGFSQDISSLFPFLFFEYFKRTDFTFVPFGVDPLVTFAKTPLQDNSQSIDRDQIVNNSVTDLDEKRLAVQIPILFGLSNLDIQLIKNNKEIYEWYTDILKNVVYQSVNRSQLIDILKSYSNDLLEVKIRDLAKYKRVLAKLIERNPKCEPYPKLCFMYYKLTNFAFGYLSEMDILNGYFEKSSYTIYNFPTSSNVYPVRLWWWIVNDAEYDRLIKPSSDGVSLAWVFFQEYITQATNGNHYLRPTLFSAFNVVLANQESDLQWKYVSQYKTKRQVNPIKLDTPSQLEQFVALLQGDYDINVFLAGLRN